MKPVVRILSADQVDWLRMATRMLRTTPRSQWSDDEKLAAFRVAEIVALMVVGVDEHGSVLVEVG